MFPPHHVAAVNWHVAALHCRHATATAQCPACLCTQKQNYGLAGNSFQHEHDMSATKVGNEGMVSCGYHWCLEG